MGSTVRFIIAHYWANALALYTPHGMRPPAKQLIRHRLLCRSASLPAPVTCVSCNHDVSAGCVRDAARLVWHHREWCFFDLQVSECHAQGDRCGVHGYNVNVLSPWRQSIASSRRGTAPWWQLFTFEMRRKKCGNKYRTWPRQQNFKLHISSKMQNFMGNMKWATAIGLFFIFLFMI